MVIEKLKKSLLEIAPSSRSSLSNAFSTDLNAKDQASTSITSKPLANQSSDKHFKSETPELSKEQLKKIHNIICALQKTDTPSVSVKDKFKDAFIRGEFSKKISNNSSIATTNLSLFSRSTPEQFSKFNDFFDTPQNSFFAPHEYQYFASKINNRLKNTIVYSNKPAKSPKTLGFTNKSSPITNSTAKSAHSFADNLHTIFITRTEHQKEFQTKQLAEIKGIAGNITDLIKPVGYFTSKIKSERQSSNYTQDWFGNTENLQDQNRERHQIKKISIKRKLSEISGIAQ